MWQMEKIWIDSTHIILVGKHNHFNNNKCWFLPVWVLKSRDAMLTIWAYVSEDIESVFGKQQADLVENLHKQISFLKKRLNGEAQCK